MASDDIARFLAGSEDRRRLLTHLRDQPGSPSEVADALDVSRRSVQRTLGKLVDRSWAEKVDGAYRLTTVGELVTGTHANYVDTLDLLDGFAPFFRYLPDADHAPEAHWLRDATLVVATQEDPQAPVHHYVDSLRSFEEDRVRMLSPVLSRLFHDAHAELALDGVRTELVLSAAMVERARELNPAEFALVVGVDVLELYRHPEPVEFGLTLGADRLLVGAYDADGHLQAVVESTDEAFRTWADRLFERYRDRSERVTLSDSLPFTRRE